MVVRGRSEKLAQPAGRGWRRALLTERPPAPLATPPPAAHAQDLPARGDGKASPGAAEPPHPAAGIIAAMSSDLDGFTTKLNAILQADLTHAAAAAGPLEVSLCAFPCLRACLLARSLACWLFACLP